jgi:hypothetical protein
MAIINLFPVGSDVLGFRSPDGQPDEEMEHQSAAHADLMPAISRFASIRGTPYGDAEQMVLLCRPTHA